MTISIVLVVTCYGSTFKELCAFAKEISTESINADELIKCGDLNSDGQINVFDVMRAKRDILNKNPQPTRIADINRLEILIPQKFKTTEIYELNLPEEAD